MVELDIVRESKVILLWCWWLEDIADLRKDPDLTQEISQTSGNIPTQTWKFPRFQDASSLRPGNFQDFRIFPDSDSGNFPCFIIFLSQVFESSTLKYDHFTLWRCFDDPFMLLSLPLYSQWLTSTIADNPPYQRYLLSTWQSTQNDEPTQWLTHLSQVPYLSACVWTRLDCCTSSESDPLTTTSLASPR